MPAKKIIVAAATLSLAIAGCGSSSGPSAGHLSATATAKLHADVASVRAAASAGNQTVALAALEQFSQSVTQDAAQISAGELAVLKRDIAQTQRILARIKPTAPPATTAAPATTTPTTPAPPGKGHGKKNHGQRGNGNGNGGGGGDGGD